MTRVLLALLFACFAAFAPAVAQGAPEIVAQGAPAIIAQDAPAIVVRQSADPASGALIGQHVALMVDVLFRDAMPHPPRVTLPDVPGLQALRFETQGTGMRDTIGGAAYVGQRFEFALYARRGGTFAIPAAVVTLLDAQGGTTGTMQGQGLSLAVAVPKGVDPSGPVVATRALTLDEQWRPAPKTAFKAGDAIIRTITRTAEDVPGLAMRDLAFPAPDGVRVYQDPPDIDDYANRGVVTGRRVDRVTYLFERAGRFVVPPASQPWWDLGAGAARIATADGATVEVAASPAGAGGTAASLVPPIWIAAVAIVLAGVGFAARILLRRRRATGADAERAAFAALRRASHGADAAALYRAFAGWRLHLAAEAREVASREAAALDAALFGRAASVWTEAQSRALVARLSRLRRSHPVSSRADALPPLNPKGGTRTVSTSFHTI